MADPTNTPDAADRPEGGTGAVALGYQFYERDNALFRAMAYDDGGLDWAHICHSKGWLDYEQPILTMYASPIDTSEAEAMLPDGVELDDDIVGSVKGQADDNELSEAARAEAKPRLRKRMSSEDIRQAGVAIDVPFEAPPGDAAELKYSDGQTFAQKFPHLLDVNHTKQGGGGSAGS